MTPRSSMLPIAVTAAVLGGGVGAGAVALLGLGGDQRTQTVIQAAPLMSGPPSRDATPTSQSDGTATALTARDIYKRDAPGVVYIKSEVVQTTQSDSPFDFGTPSSQRGTATGSGFVLDESGTILTNAHVIQGAVRVTVQLADKKTVPARVVGKDASTDLAILRIDPDGLDLRPLKLGSSKDVQVGDPVVAIGNPFGLDRTLTTGVISALQRRITAPNGFAIDNVLQTDAAINPGNSGGPLIDAAGRVIGITSQIETGGSGGSGNVGIGFAVPIDTAKQLLPKLKSSGQVEHAYLGITSLSIDDTLADLDLGTKSGALVQSVTSGSPAEKAGIHAGSLTTQLASGDEVVKGGDVITAIDGRPVAGSDDLGEIVESKKPGDEVRVDLLRQGAKTSVTVKLSDRPSNAPS